MRRTRDRGGMTIIELVVGIGILLLLVMTTGSLIVGSTRIWARRSAQAQTDTDVALAMQQVTRDLSQALSFSIEDCGRSIYFTLPARAPGEDAFLVPIRAERDQWGGVRTRWYRLMDGRLYSSEREEPLIADMPDLDPETGAPCLVFAPAGETQNRVRVTLISRRPAGDGELHTKSTQEITVRNIR